ncbi:MAG: nucleoside phosphorylase [Alloprevotella sp.]|nr:nucleoside phosphorylase [Alloprevotella sp.]MBR1651987.1 nucleoside phosphorylase [Alloprevotella sp.]MBR1653304.1 nucleoside phosphorylase [Alloprevotella sp.]
MTTNEKLPNPSGLRPADEPIPASELIINEDGSCFHLHLLPEHLADNVILVGDPGRVPVVARHFEGIEADVSNREFRCITGSFQGKRITVVSTGIGCDNIDIVLNELDACANIDFNTRLVRPQLRRLNIVRIGTCGGLQPFTPSGTFIASETSIGFDGLLNFYARRNEVCDLALEDAFCRHMAWTGNQCIAHPYVVNADEELLNRVAAADMVRGITIACGGFYGPQGRYVRLPLADPSQNDKIMRFDYTGRKVTNFEMEGSAVAGLSRLMGHRALTCCMVIANRVAHNANTDYKAKLEELIRLVLERI